MVARAEADPYRTTNVTVASEYNAFLGRSHTVDAYLAQ